MVIALFETSSSFNSDGVSTLPINPFISKCSSLYLTILFNDFRYSLTTFSVNFDDVVPNVQIN